TWPKRGATRHPAGCFQPLGGHLVDLSAVRRRAREAGHRSRCEEVAPAQALPGRGRAFDRGSGEGSRNWWHHPGVGALWGRTWASKGTARMDGDESRGFPDPRRGAPGPSPGCDCRGPAGGLEPQRVRPVVLDRGAADGALGTQGPGPATPHATLRYGEDVRADGRVGREHRPTRTFGGAVIGGARLRLPHGGDRSVAQQVSRPPLQPLNLHADGGEVIEGAEAAP